MSPEEIVSSAASYAGLRRLEDVHLPDGFRPYLPIVQALAFVDEFERLLFAADPAECEHLRRRGLDDVTARVERIDGSRTRFIRAAMAAGIEYEKAERRFDLFLRSVARVLAEMKADVVVFHAPDGRSRAAERWPSPFTATTFEDAWLHLSRETGADALHAARVGIVTAAIRFYKMAQFIAESAAVGETDSVLSDAAVNPSPVSAPEAEDESVGCTPIPPQPPNNIDLEAYAISLLLKSEYGQNVSKIARVISVARTTLSSWPNFKAALARVRADAERRKNGRRGRRDSGSDFHAEG